MAHVYRHYDQAALDAQFSLDIADLEALFARRRRTAEASLARHAPLRGLSYGEGPGRTLDLYRPARAGSAAPVLVFIHGGFWRSLDAGLFAFVADGFVPFGAMVAVLDYPLIPSTDLAGIVEACREAVIWLRRNAAACGGDPDRIHVAGNSAGGHLVAELMDPAPFVGAGLPRDAVKGGCAISGLFDLEPVRLSNQNETLGFDEGDVAAFSPITRIPRPAPPLLVAVGGAETAEFLDQSRRYAAAYVAAGNDASLIVVPVADHITVVLDHFADPSRALNRRVRALLGIEAPG